MMHLLAQTGGGGGGGGGLGNWLSPRNLQAAFWIAFVLISVLGTVIKKANEQRLKRQAEQDRRRREEDALRTGRPAVEDAQTTEIEALGGKRSTSQSARQATAEDARRKLQELAERRRSELAQVMRRAQQGGRAGSPAPPSPRPTPPTIVPPPAQIPRQRPQPQPQQKQRPQPAPHRRPPATQQLGPQGSDLDARRRREAQSNREASNRAAARERAGDAETARLDAIERVARGALSAEQAIESAYSIPGAGRGNAPGPGAASSSVATALARVGTGTQTTSASEWRKAIVLSELLHRPVGMRQDGERVL